MTRIGIISDTHGYLDLKVLKYFADCDEIWHAGDIGSLSLADKLAAFKPLRAVYGNIDGHKVRECYPENNRFACEGLSVFITHIAGKPQRYTSRVRGELWKQTADILVCGHSHILKIERAKQYGNMLHLNPGAAGKSGFHKVRTIVRLKIDGKRAYDCELIELGVGS